MKNDGRRAESVRAFARRVTLSLACALVSSCSHPVQPAKAGAPSVILISVDTCRADLFGSLTGEEPSLTPNLDRFAADAVTFEHAFIEAPHTLPSHMSMMTSVYPDVHGVKPETEPLSDSIVTLPEILHRAGYRTIGLVTSEWLKPDFGFGRGFDEYKRLHHEANYVDRVNREALRRLDRKPDLPFFAFLHYYDLHSDFEQQSEDDKLPYYSPPEYRRGLPVSSDGHEFCDAEGVCNTRYLIAMDVARQALSPAELQLIHDLYRADAPFVDAQIGIFFDELKTRGLYDGSLIIVTADHGEEFREHGRFIHSQPYDETTHVPLFIKFPAGWKGGTRVDGVVESIDIYPTILDYLGLEAPSYIQGESLLTLLDATRTRKKHAALSQATINWKRYGLRTDDVKLIVDFVSGHRQLFDLEQDPGERHDLSKERPALAAQLERRLKTLVLGNRKLHDELANGAGAPGAGDAELLSAEEKERLKALGYVN